VNSNADDEMAWADEMRRRENERYAPACDPGNDMRAGGRWARAPLGELLCRWLEFAPARWHSRDMARKMRVPLSQCWAALYEARGTLVQLESNEWTRRVK
jgi:hypothetical protein